MNNRKYLILTGIIILTIITLYFLFLHGYLRFNYVSFKRFPIQGLDVSHHQGHIKWNELQNSNYKFVFIKATEGADFVDPKFHYNWENARKNGFYVGAYHFFTLNKTGVDQANNFANTVPFNSKSLPPVIDLEFMGNNKNHFSKLELVNELNAFITIIEKKYHKKPVLYSTYEFYDYYLFENYNNYTIWIRDIFREPELSDNKQWTFWQYTNRARIEGIQNFVDLNAFHGGMEDFLKLIDNQ